MITYRFTVIQKPVLENRFRSLHFRAQAQVRREWRAAFYWEARRQKIGLLDYPVNVVVQHEFNKGTRPDTVSCVHIYKAGQDGLVDAGLFSDDSPKYIRNVIFCPPEKTDRNAVTLSLMPISTGDQEFFSPDEEIVATTTVDISD